MVGGSGEYYKNIVFGLVYITIHIYFRLLLAQEICSEVTFLFVPSR
jgi:hypothetical protein